ncbi:hypothetical protein H9P43_001934 [Blastocladiella emersonii ATCC 22665]|nr:hypothetical protein H9P43_001934 [Blastocladiella emersonii ATCC 22665]
MELDATLRPYQADLVQRALRDGNYIVCLPTGMGKTHIAFEIFYQLRAKRERHGVTVLFACTEALCKQLLGEFRSLADERGLALRPLILAGQRKGSNADFAKLDLLVTTPGKFLAMLGKDGFLEIGDLALAIFDEVHNGIKDHPYVAIAGLLRDHNEAARAAAGAGSGLHPVKLLGLTGTPVKLQQSTSVHPGIVKMMLGNLFKTFDNAQLLMVDPNADAGGQDAGVVESYEEFQPKIRTESVTFLPTFDDPDQLEITQVVWAPVHAALRRIHTAHPALLEDPVRIYTRTPSRRDDVFFPRTFSAAHLADFGTLGVYQIQSTIESVAANFRKPLSRRSKQALACDMFDALTTEQQEQIARDLVDASWHAYAAVLQQWVGGLAVVDCVKHNRDFFGRSNPALLPAVEKLVNDATRLSPRMRKIIELLDAELAGAHGTDCGIVFINNVEEAFWVSYCIHAHSPYTSGVLISGNRSTGKVTATLPPDVAARLCNGKALSKFEKGELRVLVCTSVAEEGIDVQACRVVINMTTAAINPNRLIQARGRARKEGGVMYMLCASDRDHARVVKASRSSEIAARSTAESASTGASVDLDAGWRDDRRHGSAPTPTPRTPADSSRHTASASPTSSWWEPMPMTPPTSPSPPSLVMRRTASPMRSNSVSDLTAFIGSQLVSSIRDLELSLPYSRGGSSSPSPSSSPTPSRASSTLPLASTPIVPTSRTSEVTAWSTTEPASTDTPADVDAAGLRDGVRDGSMLLSSPASVSPPAVRRAASPARTDSASVTSLPVDKRDASPTRFAPRLPHGHDDDARSDSASPSSSAPTTAPPSLTRTPTLTSAPVVAPVSTTNDAPLMLPVRNPPPSSFAPRHDLPAANPRVARALSDHDISPLLPLPTAASPRIPDSVAATHAAAVTAVFTTALIDHDLPPPPPLPAAAAPPRVPVSVAVAVPVSVAVPATTLPLKIPRTIADAKGRVMNLLTTHGGLAGTSELSRWFVERPLGDADGRPPLFHCQVRVTFPPQLLKLLASVAGDRTRIDSKADWVAGKKAAAQAAWNDVWKQLAEMGMGKTHIAFEVFYQLRMKRAREGKRPSVTVLFACTAPLCSQLFNEFRSLADDRGLPLRGLVLTGPGKGGNADFTKLDLLVTTPGKFLVMLGKDGFLTIGDLALAIFDEVHNGIKGDNYVAVANQLRRHNEAARAVQQFGSGACAIKILGLSGTPVKLQQSTSVDPETVKTMLGGLLETFDDAQLVMIDPKADHDVGVLDSYNDMEPKIRTESVSYLPTLDDPDQHSITQALWAPVHAALRRIHTDHPGLFEDLIRMYTRTTDPREEVYFPRTFHPSLLAVFDTLGVYQIQRRMENLASDLLQKSWQFPLFCILSPEQQQQVATDLSLAARYAYAVILQQWIGGIAVRHYVDYNDEIFAQPWACAPPRDSSSTPASEIMEAVVADPEATDMAPRMRKVIELLDAELEGTGDDEDEYAMVFVNNVDEAFWVCYYLTTQSPHTSGVLIGRNNSLGQAMDNFPPDVIKRSQYKTAHQMFGKGSLYVLVCTSVAEEGIDVQACRVVINMTTAAINPTRFIQSRGRARKEGGIMYMLCASDREHARIEKASLSSEIAARSTTESASSGGGALAVLEDPFYSTVTSHTTASLARPTSSLSSSSLGMVRSTSPNRANSASELTALVHDVSLGLPRGRDDAESPSSSFTSSSPPPSISAPIAATRMQPVTEPPSSSFSLPRSPPPAASTRSPSPFDDDDLPPPPPLPSAPAAAEPGPRRSTLPLKIPSSILDNKGRIMHLLATYGGVTNPSELSCWYVERPTAAPTAIPPLFHCHVRVVFPPLLADVLAPVAGNILKLDSAAGWVASKDEAAQDAWADVWKKLSDMGAVLVN